jgi:hypothetical protein
MWTLHPAPSLLTWAAALRSGSTPVLGCNCPASTPDKLARTLGNILFASMRSVDRLPHRALSLEALSQATPCARRGRQAPHPSRVCSPDARFRAVFGEAGYTHPQIVTSARRSLLRAQVEALQPSSTRRECFQTVSRQRAALVANFSCESFRRPVSKSIWAARPGRFSKGLMREPEKSWRALFRTAPPATVCG